ncbi:unnamed protein product [Brassica oleracea var. botrytis]
MRLLETFECIWSSKEVKYVIIGRAEQGSERRAEVARISHPSRSDLPKRHPEVARVSMARRHEAKPGATSQSDPLRIVSRLKVDSLIDHLSSLVRNLITQGLISMPMSSLFP